MQGAVLRAAFAQVRPLNCQEWLRDRLAAGLCGVDVPLDVGQAHRVQPPPHRSNAQDTPSPDQWRTPAPPVIKEWTDEVEEIPPAVTVEHGAVTTQSPEVIGNDDADRVAAGEEDEPKLSDLARLFV